MSASMFDSVSVVRADLKSKEWSNKEACKTEDQKLTKDLKV